MGLLTNDMALRLSGLANTAQSVGAATPQTQAIVQQAAQATEDMRPKNPFSMVDYGDYISPGRGTVRYGVGFGGGLSGDSATQQLFGKAPDLAGLWAMGFDQSDPNNNYKLWEFHQDRMKNDADYKKYVTQEASKNNWNLNDIQGITYGADWYYRDLARRMGQSNSFMDSTLGKILGTALTIGAGALGGPLAGGLVGGVTGGVSSGNVLGGLLGAAGGYLGGGGALPEAISSTGIRNALGGAIAGGSILNQMGGGSSNTSGNFSDQPQQQPTNPVPGVLLSGIPGLLNQPTQPAQQVSQPSQTTSQSLSIPTASAEESVGLLGGGWGGKFDKFKSPYKQQRLMKSKVVNAFRSA